MEEISAHSSSNDSAISNVVTFSVSNANSADGHMEAAVGRSITQRSPQNGNHVPVSATAPAVAARATERAGQEIQSDAQLMIAVGQGECAALEKLYDRYVGNCFGLAMSFVQEPHLAEEIVRDVFAMLWTQPETFLPERGALCARLMATVRNRSLDMLRHPNRRPALQILLRQTDDISSATLIDALPDYAPIPHEQASTEEVGCAVQHALRQLSGSEYQVIALAYFGGLTQQEIADQLQQPLGTIKTLTRSALRRLHQVLVAQGALSE